MVFGLNLVDLLVLLFVFLYGALIFKRGFLAQLFEFLGFSISLSFAILFFPYLAQLFVWLKIQSTIADSFAFINIWVGTGLAFLFLFNTIFKKLPMALILSKFNRYLGIIPNLLSSLLIVIFITTVVIVLPTPTSIKTQVTQSKIVGSLLPLTIGISAPLDQAFAGSVREGLVHLTSKEPDNQSFVRLNFPNLKLENDPDSEKVLFYLLNQRRKLSGLEILTIDQTLVTIARKHSKAMFTKGYFGHIDPKGQTPYDRAVAEDLVFESLGENISFAPDVQTAQKGFLNSPGHLKLMLETKYTRVGIGVYDSGNYGKMFTESFAN